MTNNSPKNFIRIFVEQFGLCSLFENATFVTVNSENVFRVFGTSELKKLQNLFSNNYSFYSLRALSGNKYSLHHLDSFSSGVQESQVEIVMSVKGCIYICLKIGMKKVLIYWFVKVKGTGHEKYMGLQ